MPIVADTRRHRILAAIDIALAEMDGVLSDGRLSGLQVTVKMGGAAGVRTVIIEPELRFEVIACAVNGWDSCGPPARRTG